MKTFILIVATALVTNTLNAEIVYEDDFSGASLAPVWNTTTGAPATFDAANDQVDYAHTTGTARRFLSGGTILINKTGYLKASISNFSGAESVWFGFVGPNPGNNTNYAQTKITGDGIYELFFNNSAGSLSFDNGAGWTGTLAAQTGLWSIDGGTSSAAITIGSAIVPDTTMFGFGFANFGNASLFPTSAFSLDSILVSDSLTISTATNTKPTVTIISPAGGTSAISGTNVNFGGTANDAEDGTLTASISWHSNINGNLGVGGGIDVSTLSLGTHLITASATDSGGITGSLSITLTVTSLLADGGRSQPNIIVIISDDAGYADFSFMDGLSGKTSEVPTPNLDALAARGITFARAYVAANCQPTRAALVTGAYQQRIGNESVGNNHFRLTDIPEGVPVATNTIWDRMGGLGYRTGAIGKWHLGQIENLPPSASTPGRLGNRPQNQGIDEFYGMWHGSRDYTVGTYNRNAVNDLQHALQPRFIREALVLPDGSKTDTVVEYSKFVDVPSAPKYITNIFGQYAVDFVKDHHDDPEPFFLYVAHPAPHKPWTDESPDFADPRINGGPKPGGGNYPSLVGFRKQVASMTITMDKEIGHLMDTLEDPNGDMDTSDSIADNTLVVFLNDNGGVSGRDAANGNVNGTDNGKLAGFKGSAHDGGIRVPMIVAGAGIDPSKQGSIYYRPVHGVDILPTAVALGGGALDPAAEKLDGVNLLPFLNGVSSASPHEVIVHKWRGSFAVIKDDWKLFNKRNVSASPTFYELYKITDGDADADVGELDNLINVPANAALVEELKRHLTHHEAFFDKPRYAILSNTLETEPINIFDHHVFRPGLHNSWSGGVDIAADPVTGIRNWYEAGTTNEKFLFNTDSFAGAALEFPVSATDYTANNDYRRKTGMQYMLNKIILSGDFSAGTDRSATISGNDIIFTNDLRGNAPQIALDATRSGSFDFSYDIDLNVVLYHDLSITGNGTAKLTISGEVSEYFIPRGIRKTGSCAASITGLRSYSGDTTVVAGTLVLGQANANDETASISIAAAGATLNLDFTGTDTVGKLFVGGVQQPAGVYEAIGNPGGGTEIPQISGQGTLTVAAD